MLAFQIALNGKGLVTAGLPGPGVLSAIVSSVRRAPTDTAPEGARFVEQELKLSVGGLATLVREHIDWANVDLKVGDEIVVRVVEVADVDPPQQRRGGKAASGKAASSKAASSKAASSKAASGKAASSKAASSKAASSKAASSKAASSTKGTAPSEPPGRARKKAAPAGKKRKRAG